MNGPPLFVAQAKMAPGRWRNSRTASVQSKRHSSGLSPPTAITLHWARTTRCDHDAPPEALHADQLLQMIWYLCRVGASSDTEITCSGPAVNVRLSDAIHGGTCHVPCLCLPWWPEKKEDFLQLHRGPTSGGDMARHCSVRGPYCVRRTLGQRHPTSM